MIADLHTLPYSRKGSYASAEPARGAGFFSGFCFFSRRNSRIHRPPGMPREQARKAEETGIYLLNTPMVPKISMGVFKQLLLYTE